MGDQNDMKVVDLLNFIANLPYDGLLILFSIFINFNQS